MELLVTTAVKTLTPASMKSVWEQDAENIRT
jgi:hypothetical protein